MSKNPTAVAAKQPLIAHRDVEQQFADLIAATSVWIQTHWLQMLIAAAIATAISFALFGARNLGARLARRSESGTGWPAVFGRAITKTNTFFIITLAAKLVLNVADAPSQVVKTIDFLFTVAAVFQAAVWAREIILGAVEHRARSEVYSGEALGSAMGLIRILVTFALFAVALIVVLSNVGVNVTGLVAGLGVGGIAIGLAAQGIFADLFAALAIIFDRPFRRGDNISYDTASGSVESIGLKSTRIRGIDGEERVISNKNLLDKEILNNTLRNHRRARFTIGVNYATPADICARLPAMFQEVVEAAGAIFVRAGFIGFGASSLDFEVQFDSDGADYARFYDGRTTIGIGILKRLNDEKIDIAFPTQTTLTAAPDGSLIMPYAPVQNVHSVDAAAQPADRDGPLAKSSRSG